MYNLGFYSSTIHPYFSDILERSFFRIATNGIYQPSSDDKITMADQHDPKKGKDTILKIIIILY